VGSLRKVEVEDGGNGAEIGQRHEHALVATNDDIPEIDALLEHLDRGDLSFGSDGQLQGPATADRYRQGGVEDL